MKKFIPPSSAPHGALPGSKRFTSRTVGFLLALVASVVPLTAQIEVISNGNVGIGTNAPANKLEINGGRVLIGDGTDSGWLFPGSSGGLTAFHIGSKTNVPLAFFTNSSAPHLMISTGGDVGIGTTSPGAKLDVQGSGGPALRLFDGVSDTGSIDFRRSSDGWHMGTIKMSHAGNYGANLSFKLHPNDGSQPTAPVEIVTMLASGNVGIGTSNPSAPLHIYRAGQPEVRLQGTSRQWAVLSNEYWGANGLSFYDITADVARLQISTSGNVGIGTIYPGYKLEVAGTVRATSFVSNTTTYADFVFKPGYRLAPLSEIEAHIEEHGHLPDIPSEAQVAKEGIDLAAMQVKLLQKIEELTLHVIRQEKENSKLRHSVEMVQQQLSKLSLKP